MTAKDLCEKVLAADKTWKQSCDCCVTYPCGKVAGKCEWVFTDAAPLLAKMLLKAIEELKRHTEATTGYYSGQCTGDSYDAQETLKELDRIAAGEGNDE